jgi:hypothetical protein
LRPLKRALPVETIRSMREHRTSHVNHPLKIPGHFLLIRAAVLARWSQWCLREGVSLAGAAIPSVEPLRSGHM